MSYMAVPVDKVRDTVTVQCWPAVKGCCVVCVWCLLVVCVVLLALQVVFLVDILVTSLAFVLAPSVIFWMYLEPMHA